MLREVLLFLVGASTCSTGILGEPLYEPELNCTDVSKDADDWVFKYNNFITTGGDDTVNVDGFQTTMRPHFLGIPLPVQAHMEVPVGLLQSLNEFTRIGPVSVCRRTTTSNDTVGLYQFKDMKIIYKGFTAKILFWEIQGNFIYEFEPELNVIMRKDNDPLVMDCGPVKPLTLASSGPSKYVIETDDSWKSWFLNKILHRALVTDDNTPMLELFLERAWVSLNVYYSTYIC